MQYDLPAAQALTLWIVQLCNDFKDIIPGMALSRRYLVVPGRLVVVVMVLMGCRGWRKRWLWPSRWWW